MIIWSNLIKSVAFICYRDKNQIIRFGGTCFYLGLLEGEEGGFFRYSISAKHVIVKVKEKSIDNKVLMRVNLKGGGVEYIETNADEWVHNPDDPTDVSVLDWSPPPGDQYDVVHIASDMILNEANVEFFQKPGIGDEVVAIGLFVNHTGKKKNIPIVRIGNIAAMLDEKVATRKFGNIDAYLIESRSIGGLSGSPVFAHLSTPRINEDGTLNSEIKLMRHLWLLGIIHGHYDVKAPNEDIAVEDAIKEEAINMGIAIVTPVEKIVDVLYLNEFKKRRKEEMDNIKENKLPSKDFVGEGEND